MPESTEVHALQARLFKDIPLARHLGVEVIIVEAGAVKLRAPLAANSNHKGTAFGGSLYSLAVLAGWGMLSTALERRGVSAEVVIQDAHVDYATPVTGDFTASAALPDAEALERCLAMLSRRGRGRIALTAVIEQGGAAAVTLRGTFVIHRTSQGEA